MDSKTQIKNDEFDILFYEGVLQSSGDFVEALMALGDLYTKAGKIELGLQVDEKLARLRPEDPYVFYNLACSYSLLRNIDSAYDAVKKAIALGYTDFRFMLQDDDLANLRQDDRFRKFLSQLGKTTKT